MFRFARIKTPWLKNSFTNWFVATYKVDLSEAERENVKDYDHFNDFFTRPLKKSSRPISSSPLISPVDGVVSQAGKINKSEIVQAKGKKYSVSALLDDKSLVIDYFNSFATIYLSPKDYHRIHMPCDGDLVSMKYIPGDLFSVNKQTVNNLDQVFARNERLVCFFNTEFGEMIFILVGAIFVGSMQTSWEGQISPPYSKSVKHYDYKEEEIRLKKGVELGRFNMGSTVIILLSNDFPDLSLEEGQALKMGQSIT